MDSVNSSICARYASFVALVLVVASSGCGSSKPSLELEGDTRTTGGKALVFTATTDEKLAYAGGDYAIELRGVDVNRSERATFERPDYLDKRRCDAEPCEWTIIPGAASTYEFRAFLIDLRKNESAGQSQPVQIDWDAPPRPHALELVVNGMTPPTTPLNGEDYSDIPAGKMEVAARWTTDARDTGYYVVISVGDRVYARCSTGTSCVVPEKVPILVDQEVSWVIKLLTDRGNKVVGGFKVCLAGRA